MVIFIKKKDKAVLYVTLDVWKELPVAYLQDMYLKLKLNILGIGNLILNKPASFWIKGWIKDVIWLKYYMI